MFGDALGKDEIVIAFGAFSSILVFKYLLSRTEDLTNFTQTWFTGRSEPQQKPVETKEKPPSTSGRDEKSPTVAGPADLTVSGNLDKNLPVIGLDNLGNNCYLNSLMQAIVCIPEFVFWLHRSRNAVCLYQKPPGRPAQDQKDLGKPARYLFQNHLVPVPEKRVRGFFHSLCRVVDVLGHRTGTRTDCYAATSLMGVLFDGIGSGARYYQQDPDELFLFMINLLSRALLHQENPLFQSDEILPTDLPPQIVVLSVAKPHVVKIDRLAQKPWMSQPFQGLLYQDLLCVICKNSRAQPLEIFNSLSVTLPHSQGRREAYFLEDLLKHYFTPADLDSVECPHCSRTASINETWSKPMVRTPHLKRTSLARLPKILCIHIRRAIWQGTDSGKRRDHVNFSGSLVMKEFSWLMHINGGTGLSKQTQPFLSNRSNGFPDGTDVHSRAIGNSIYDLKSVVVHVGDSSSRGHIVAYRRGPVQSRNADCWYYTSDHIVRQTTWAEVGSCDPYILFYELKDEAAPRDMLLR